MILRLYLLFWICTLTKVSISQEKYDYQWMLGYDATAMPGDNATMFDFNMDSLSVLVIDREMEFEASNSSICDAEGNLLFYTNGCEVRDSSGNFIEGTDAMSSGFIDDNYCPLSSPTSQSAISLPHPNGHDYYMFFYEYIVLSDPVINVIPQKLHYFLFEEEDDGVRLKERATILEDTLVGYAQAVKHANGRDWWLVNHNFRGNCFYSHLIHPDGIEAPIEQCLGEVWDDIVISGQSTFSPDGTKFVFANARNGINIYDFDRCTGTFSNPIRLESLVQDDFVGLAIAPNSRYMYVNFNTTLYQYDLWADDIEESKIFIDESDGMPFPYYSVFYLMQLAPDGKIYISGTGSHKHIHVIHEPNKHGLACNFEQHGVSLPSFNIYTMPNFPHYRLGALEGSLCDSLIVNVNTVRTSKEQDFKIFPNPFQDIIQITLENNHIEVISIYNSSGQHIQTIKSQNSKKETINLSSIANGVYFINITNTSGLESWHRIIKQD